jgi:tRNA(Phe) wybutosine-synthesizing methylase Tyw3
MNTDHTLPSFRHTKSSVLTNLYGTNEALRKDLSPKGSVDAPIRELVFRLNQHPDYATLSSCSGRIALFDPNTINVHAQSSPTLPKPQSNEETTHNGTGSGSGVTSSSSDGNCCVYPSKAAASVEKNASIPSSGKGGGTWLLSSHAPITYEQLDQALTFQSPTQAASPSPSPTSTLPLTFKHEPFLMHVACRSLHAAQLLLKLCLELGYRESGIITTPAAASQGHGNGSGNVADGNNNNNNSSRRQKTRKKYPNRNFGTKPPHVLAHEAEAKANALNKEQGNGNGNSTTSSSIIDCGPKMKMIVAIRSMGLALSVPLSRKPAPAQDKASAEQDDPSSNGSFAPFYPGQEYLRALVAEANRRMDENLRRLQRFETALSTTLPNSSTIKSITTQEEGM